MSLPGERLLIVATPDMVKEGDTFDEIPPHMTITRWHTIQEHRRGRLLKAMDNLFTDQPAFNEATAGRLTLLGRWNKPVLVHRVENLETISEDDDRNPQWFALHALVNSLGRFDEEDKFKDTFLPHITRTKGFKLRKNEPVAFSSVALIGTEGSHQQQRVIASFQLGRGNEQ